MFFCAFCRETGLKEGRRRWIWRRSRGGCVQVEGLVNTDVDGYDIDTWMTRYEWWVSNPDLQNPRVKSIYLMFEILIQCMRFSLTLLHEWLMISKTKRFMNTVLNLESWFKNYDINYELVLNWKRWSVAWYTWKASSPGFTFYTLKASSPGFTFYTLKA